MARCGARGDREANLRSRVEVEVCVRFQNFLMCSGGSGGNDKDLGEDRAYAYGAKPREKVRSNYLGVWKRGGELAEGRGRIREVPATRAGRGSLRRDPEREEKEGKMHSKKRRGWGGEEREFGGGAGVVFGKKGGWAVPKVCGQFGGWGGSAVIQCPGVWVLEREDGGGVAGGNEGSQRLSCPQWPLPWGPAPCKADTLPCRAMEEPDAPHGARASGSVAGWQRWGALGPFHLAPAGSWTVLLASLLGSGSLRWSVSCPCGEATPAQPQGWKRAARGAWEPEDSPFRRSMNVAGVPVLGVHGGDTAPTRATSSLCPMYPMKPRTHMVSRPPLAPSDLETSGPRGPHLPVRPRSLRPITDSAGITKAQLGQQRPTGLTVAHTCPPPSMRDFARVHTSSEPQNYPPPLPPHRAA